MGIRSSFTTYRHRAANKTVGDIQQPRIHAGEMFKGKNNIKFYFKGKIVLKIIFITDMLYTNMIYFVKEISISFLSVLV